MRFQDIAPSQGQTPARPHTAPVRAPHRSSGHSRAPEQISIPARSKKATTDTSKKGYLLIMAIAATLGMLAQFQIIGQIVILLYAAATIRFKIPARTTLHVALLSLGVAVVTIVLGRTLVAQNFAAYSFLFFIVAALGSVLEQWRLSKALRENSSKPPQ